MKRIILLLLALCAISVQAQQTVRPSTCDYRYDTFEFPGNPYLSFTNWFIDLMYRDLPQGRTYRRQMSEDGNWRFEGEPIVVPEIPGATATFSDGINIHPSYTPTHYLRLVVVATNTPEALVKRQMKVIEDLAETSEAGIEASAPLRGKKALKKEIVIHVPPHGVLRYTPVKK